VTREGQEKQQGIAGLEDSFGERSFERTALTRRAISHEGRFAGSRGGDRTPPVMLFIVFGHVPNDGEEWKPGRWVLNVDQGDAVLGYTIRRCRDKRLGEFTRPTAEDTQSRI
jgi:hypothetical protein